MASVFSWIELGLKYSKSVIALFLFLISLSGYNIYGNFDKTAIIEEREVAIKEKEKEIKEKEKDVIASQKQLTNVAEHFYITTTPKKVKPKYPQINCTAACIKIINNAINKGLNKHEKGRLH